MNHTYVIYIRYDGNPTFMIPVESTGVDARDAARQRVLKLLDPYRYDDVLAVHTSLHGVAQIYSIAELMGESRQPSMGPRPRYGWRG